jgi:ATP-dependent exoDNAse (exonuclease V) beta subunit
LYFSAGLQDGRLRPARGSLAEVMPLSLIAAFDAAAAAGSSEVTWAGTSASHRIAVHRAVDARRLTEAATERDPIAAHLTALADEDPMPRLAVTGSRTDADRLPLEWAPDVTTAGTEARLAGTLVHRALEQIGRIRDDSDAMLARRLASLVRDTDRAGSGIASGAVGLGVSVLRRMLSRPAVQALLADGEWLEEVPFSWRGTDADGRRAIVRGTIDTVVRLPDGQHVVVEFKTGRRMPGHDAQLAIYLEAARALFPEAPARGLLVYPDDDVWTTTTPPVST